MPGRVHLLGPGVSPIHPSAPASPDVEPVFLHDRGLWTEVSRGRLRPYLEYGMTPISVASSATNGQPILLTSIASWSRLSATLGLLLCPPSAFAPPLTATRGNCLWHSVTAPCVPITDISGNLGRVVGETAMLEHAQTHVEDLRADLDTDPSTFCATPSCLSQLPL